VGGHPLHGGWPWSDQKSDRSIDFLLFFMQSAIHTLDFIANKGNCGLNIKLFGEFFFNLWRGGMAQVQERMNEKKMETGRGPGACRCFYLPLFRPTRNFGSVANIIVWRGVSKGVKDCHRPPALRAIPEMAIRSFQW
jgi:hypothetical protein